MTRYNFIVVSCERAFDDVDAHGNITWSVSVKKWFGMSTGDEFKVLIKTYPQNRPKIGEKILGHTEPTKSGNGLWLKKAPKKRKGPRRKTNKRIEAEMRRDKKFHENLCDKDGKGKLRFGSKMAGKTTHAKSKRAKQRGKYS